MDNTEKMKVLSELGWNEYYNEYCYKTDWVEQGKAYDRMAMPIEDAYNDEIKKGNIDG